MGRIDGPRLNAVKMVSPAVTTQYWAEFVYDNCVSQTSTITVNVCKPTITAESQSVSINSGQSVTLSVSAIGALLSYQWHVGLAGDVSNPIIGGVGNAVTVAPAASSEYWVRATGCGIADSRTATVTVCVPPSINSMTTSSSQSAQFMSNQAYVSVNASGTALSYQWYKGYSGDTSHPVTDGNVATYNFTARQSAYYWPVCAAPSTVSRSCIR
ncbi:MAG TPA: hypothetical protein VF762_01255 [Blastocatellia bacterium]|jgi:hypothetical protein